MKWYKSKMDVWAGRISWFIVGLLGIRGIVYDESFRPLWFIVAVLGFVNAILAGRWSYKDEFRHNN